MMGTGQWLYEAFCEEMTFPNQDVRLLPWGDLTHAERDAWQRLEDRCIEEEFLLHVT